MKTTRRTFLEAVGAGVAGTVLARPVFGATAGHGRPNVVLIYSDDQGALDLNCFGSDDLHTPNLDELARRGVRFTRFYAASSVCAPSRAALLTGRYPQRTGVPGNTESRPEFFGTRGGLKEDEVTIAELLRQKGYRTGHFGKWHLGAEPGPNGHGFDESVGFLGGCIDRYSHFNYGGAPWGVPPQRHDWYRNGEEAWESGAHAGDLIVRHATRFMEECGSAPFFMYLAFGSPHYPMQPYDKYREIYRNLKEPRRSYAALVSTLDEQVGRILKRLKDLGLDERTLVIFQSDQGHSTEARANYGGGNAGRYRGAKASLFEGGLRVPAIACLPGVIPEGETRSQFCTSCDWYPTIAELCGASPTETLLDGRSLKNVLRSAAAPAPHARWHWQLGNQWAVRDGDWKLIENARDTTDGRNIKRLDEPFLANLAQDPGESTNLAKTRPEKAAQLRKLHQAWARSVADGAN
jgi:arylsulfatase A-like enzyme